jgi:hypothetical protein
MSFREFKPTRIDLLPSFRFFARLAGNNLFFGFAEGFENAKSV